MCVYHTVLYSFIKLVQFFSQNILFRFFILYWQIPTQLLLPLCSYWGAHFSLFWARKGTQQSISSIWPNALLSFSFCIYLDSFWDCFASCVQIDYGMGTILSWKGKRKKTNKHFILCISFGYYQISSCQKCREGACNCTSGGKILEL